MFWKHPQISFHGQGYKIYFLCAPSWLNCKVNKTQGWFQPEIVRVKDKIDEEFTLLYLSDWIPEVRTNFKGLCRDLGLYVNYILQNLKHLRQK